MSEDGLARFVPRFVQDALRGKSEITASIETVPGVVLSADIAGFTALTEQLAKGGQAGIEGIQRVLNRTFPRFVSAIEEHGGDVLKFAGDATIAWWPGNARQSADAAAARLQAVMPEVQQDVGHPLRLRVEIGVGDVWTAIVGGEGERWEGVVGGEAFRLLTAARSGNREAGSGQHAAGDDMESPLLAAFIPTHIVEAVRTQRLGSIAELRAVSMLFMSAALAETPTLHELQGLVVTIQKTVAEFGGSIIQVLVDDKGMFVVLAAWGIPLASYVNDAERAALAAFELNARLQRIGVAASIGVASGRAFSGLRGAESRAEYALIGNVVNRSARLMMKASGGVLCDDATSKGAGAVAFDLKDTADLKGMGAVRMYAPRRRSRAIRVAGELRGRVVEIADLQRALDGATAERSTAVVIEGDAGIGKSHLVHAFIESARGAGTVVGVSAADPLDRDTPYFALRSALQALTDLEPSRDGRTERLLELIGAGERSRHAPLIGAVLDVATGKTDLTQYMSGQARADATEDLIVHVLSSTYAGAARALVIDDAHWMDAASWRVLDQARKRVPGLCIIIVARPLDTALSDPRHKPVCDDPWTLRIALGPLRPADVPALLGDLLAVTIVPEMLSRFVTERSRGHPLVAREIVVALQAAGVIEKPEADRATVDAARLEQVRLPDSLQGLAAARIDRLAPTQQLVLKAASVLGRDFSVDIVSALSGAESGASASLSVMVEQGVLRCDDTTYAFTDAVTRDAAYELLPPTRRRELHASAAAWYESHHADDASFVGRIARHYTEAHDARAIAALERAGDQALRTGALREGQTLYRRLTTIAQDGFGDGAPAHPASPDQLGRWLRKLGVAEYALGDLALSREHLSQCMSVLGSPIPAPGLPAGVGLLREVSRFGVRLVTNKFTRPVPNARAPDLVPGLLTISGIFNLAGRPELSLYTALRSYNVAERTGPTPELMLALGPITYVVTLMKMVRLGETYMKCIEATHKHLNRPREYAEGMYAGCMAALGQGLLDRARREVGESCKVYREIGERRGFLSALAGLGTVEMHAGNAAAAADAYRELYTIASEIGDALTLAWGSGGLGILALRAGEYQRSIELSAICGTNAREANETVTFMSARGTTAVAHMRLGDVDVARPIVDESFVLVEAQPARSVAFHSIQGFDTTAEALQLLWEMDAKIDPERARRTYAQRVRLVNTRLRALAGTFALVKHVAVLRAAGEAWLLGDHGRAIKLWKRVTTGALREGRVFDAGRAHLELARHLPPGAEREQHVRAAASLLRPMSAQGELAYAHARGLEIPVIQ